MEKMFNFAAETNYYLILYFMKKFILIAVIVVLYVVLYLWFRNNKQKVYDYLENNAAAYKA